jgi:lipoprotein-releasing system ATP-binding protein
VLNVSGVGKQYPTPRGPLTVLSDVSFTLSPGDAAAITGPSGSGKSSLLYMLGALEPPSQGTITLDGRNPFDLGAAALADFRNTSIGFVFQDHCLLPQCSVLEDHRPGELSGGEKQRAAIARALVREPRLVLCDEPTGNLDQASASTVASMLLDLHARQRNILIVVTHSERLAGQFPIRFDISDGRLRRVG